MDKGERKKVGDYVRYLLSKGYSKEDVKKDLLSKGFDRFFVREVIYPYLRLWIYFGILLICMILVIGGVYLFVLLSGGDVKVKPIEMENTLVDVEGLVVDNLEIRGENGEYIVEVYLVNHEDEDYDSPIEIEVMSGGFSMSWMELRGVASGGTLMSSAPGFVFIENPVKVYLNSQEIYQGNFSLEDGN